MEITEDFSGQLAEITTGSEAGEAAQAEFLRRACHRKEDRGTKDKGLKTEFLEELCLGQQKNVTLDITCGIF